ncbi:TPA: ABC transporter substrate-binding protein, partial [Candidatus Woesearchaeota archaeon]|nr:ABC transporter substrate-binding protein [Candidatus Woesearchaeota archaeon]
MNYKLPLMILGILVVIGAGLAVTLIVTSDNQPAQGEREDPGRAIRIGDLPVVHGLPLYVALEKGYFEQEGLQVERVRFDAPNQIIDALLQDKIDLGSPSLALGITGIANSKNPGKLKIYAVSGGSDANPNENLLVPLDSTINSIEDLKGKKLGILGGTIQWRTITREL